MTDQHKYDALIEQEDKPKDKSKCARVFLIFQMTTVSILIIYLFCKENIMKKIPQRKGLALFRSPVYQSVFNLEGAVFRSDFESGNLKSAV